MSLMLSSPSTGRAPFAIRGINVCESLSRHTEAQVRRLLDRLVEWRMNTLLVHPAYGYRGYEELIREHCREQGIGLVHYLYTTLQFAAGASPELFARDEAGRPHRERLECETRLCPSLAAARSVFREGARRYLNEQLEQGDQVVLATPDGVALCRCPNCRKLNAVEQWQPMLEIAVEEIQRSGKELKTHFLAYIRRFALPADMGVFAQIDSVMFDTHLRYRWQPLGADHPTGPLEEGEAESDSRAAKMPMNRYLYDRLVEWRRAFSGQLYVFENLMIQGCFSLPQPNTGILLQDQETFRSIGVDGIIYEAFEPGMEAFSEQLGELSSGMLGEDVPHRTSELESLCREGSMPVSARLRVLPYLFADFWNEKAATRHMPSTAHAELAMAILCYLDQPVFAQWLAVVQLVLAHRERLDWIYIAYRLATYLPATERPVQLTKKQVGLFSTPKPWDYLEPLDNPQAHMLNLLRGFLQPATVVA